MEELGKWLSKRSGQGISQTKMVGASIYGV